MVTRHTDIPHSKARLAFHIGAAEFASTAISLGAVLIALRNEQAFQPLTDWASRKLGNEDRGKFAVNGGIMLGSGFISHIPIQLLLERRFALHDIQSVAINKAIGITSAVAAIAVAKSLMPEAMDNLEKKLTEAITRSNLHTFVSDSNADDLVRLLAIEVPSSLIAGFINYRFSHALR